MDPRIRTPTRHRIARNPRWIAFFALLLVAPWTAVAAEHPFLAKPIWVYDNWSAYDELSDAVPLTEDLAMRELAEIVRLRKLGVDRVLVTREPDGSWSFSSALDASRLLDNGQVDSASWAMRTFAVRYGQP